MSASHDQKAFEARDYYELLGVAKDSTGKQITKAYRKTALRYHPDHNRSDYATAAFQHLTRVHQVLTKDALRKMYDRTGSVEDEDMQFEVRLFVNGWVCRVCVCGDLLYVLRCVV
jgi:DnaJ-class molecular chaperone